MLQSDPEPEAVVDVGGVEAVEPVEPVEAVEVDLVEAVEAVVVERDVVVLPPVIIVVVTLVVLPLAAVVVDLMLQKPNVTSHRSAGHDAVAYVEQGRDPSLDTHEPPAPSSLPYHLQYEVGHVVLS
jgi:hypothetical protein